MTIHTSILVPVLNEEQNLSNLWKRLLPVLRKNATAELILIDNESKDHSWALLKKFRAACPKQVRIAQESKRGWAPPLNRGLSLAKGEHLLFVDADTEPSSAWFPAMIAALENHDLVVGQTLSGKTTSKFGTIVQKIFHRHSERTSQAIGYTLPWGPTCNLGVKKTWFRKVGAFSSQAQGAFDIDWCWRALLAGAKIHYASKAKIVHHHRQDRVAILRQFERYGRSEAWLHHQYSFLEDAAALPVSPLETAMSARSRLLASFRKPSEEALEIASAFACGVYGGFSGKLEKCSLPRRLPKKPVSWALGDKEILFVPGKGVTTLDAQPRELWLWLEKGLSEQQVLEEMVHHWKCTKAQAKSFLREFSLMIQS